MPLLQALYADGYFALDETAARAAGDRLAHRYRSAAPFPHAVIDDFLPESALERVVREFPKRSAVQESYHRQQEFRKSRFDPNDLAPGFSQSLFHALNARPFLVFLEQLTGIHALLPDPYFVGGGFHEIGRGGKLGVHADFNLHPRLNLRRRLNVLIYLNRDWPSEYGGELQLWDRAMTRCEEAVAPLFNRCVIFNTDDDSFHGHPDPLRCPEERSRCSIALYYYTASLAIRHELRSHTTDFRARPGSGDRRDVGVKADELAREWLPPVTYRGLRRLMQRLRPAATPR